jgi:hypothetical protein
MRFGARSKGLTSRSASRELNAIERAVADIDRLEAACAGAIARLEREISPRA